MIIKNETDEFNHRSFYGILKYIIKQKGSYEKANEMNNFMLTGIDSSVSIFMPSEGKTKPIVIKGHPIHEGMLMNGQLCTERFERNWTQGKASEILYDDKKSHESANDEDMDFADAVANIPVNEQGMEQ